MSTSSETNPIASSASFDRRSLLRLGSALLGAGKPYDQQSLHTPGVCKLPGPNRKVNFPDPDKHKDTEKVPGMCQLCSTVCGTIAHVKDGRVIKIDGNPKDPNSRGKLCARGQAGLNHQYHPERLLYPLKRVGSRRAANLTYLFESDWDLGNYEHSKYILNFGSNMFEAHQGHVAGAQRIQNGRFGNGAKLVTFDVRMSNTAGNSAEFFMPRPGTDGAIALAMGHGIVKEGLADKKWFSTWANVSLKEVWENVLADATPEWAEKVSTVRAADIARITREFATAAPEATTMCNRGSSAHVNGYNDRCIILLNPPYSRASAPAHPIRPVAHELASLR